MQINDLGHSWAENVDGLAIVRKQEIPDDLVQGLQAERLASAHVRAGEFHRVASVPVFVWDMWIREGRDPHRASPKQILRWLAAADLNAFVTTSKAV